MPKDLYSWLHYSALKWMMPGEAVKADHGGTWHKASGDESWTECGRWVAGSNLRSKAGRNEKMKSPWWGSGHLATDVLCGYCFEFEKPILHDLERIVIRGEEP